MAQTKAHKKKRRSQAPIALVYFITMIIFLFVIGMLALYALREFGVIGNDDSDSAKKIIIMPVSAFTVSGSQTMREIHEEGGMVKLKAAVADTFGITIDNYVSLTNDAFENAADIVGGITYTPDEELYYLSQDNDENDIAIPSGDLTNLSGHQIRLICQYPVFKEGRNGNMKFLGTAVTMLINNAFQQTNITKDNLDNFYNIFTANSDTDWTSAQYKEEKSYLKDMLDQNLTPAEALVPEGEWTDDSHFKVSDKFKESVQTMLKDTAPSAAEK